MRKNNKFRHIWLTVFLLVTMSCSSPSSPVQTVSDSTVVFEINGQAISRDRYVKELKALKRKYRFENSQGTSSNQELWLKSDTLNEIIKDTLFQQEVVKNNIVVTDEELKQAVQKMMNDNQEESLQRYKETGNANLQEWQNKLKNNMLIKSLINKVVNSKVSVSESDLRDYFNKHPEEFQTKDQIRSLHIMVETEDEARNILKQLSSGKSDFSHLAKEYSLGPERIKGGDLGYFESGHMPEEFDDIFKLGINEVSSIIHSPYGFHIFKVIDKKSSRKMSFEESRKLVYNKLFQANYEVAFQQWLKKLKDDANIKINYDVLAQIE